VRVLFSMPFFSTEFLDGAFSEAHVSKLQRTFLATGDRIVDISLLTESATRSRCASRDRIVDRLLLGVRLGPSPKARDPFV
jgi:hypothetical protein